MRKVQELTHAALLALLDYEPETGVFRWKTNRRGQVKAGDVAGCDSHGYIAIRLLGRIYLAHRLAWFYVHGEWPQNDIDHINGKRPDNRIANLRDVKRVVNLQNQRVATVRNSSGLIGAHRSRNQFVSLISVHGKRVFIGRFATAIEAHEAYVAAKRRLHSGCTI